MRSISILGATGSIGASTLDLIRRNRGEWRVAALTARSQAAELATLAKEFGAELAVVSDESCLPALRERLAGSGIEAVGGAAAVADAAARGADITVAAIVGCAGLAPTMAAIERGGVVALANKEALVSAGEVMTVAVARHGATLLPVDSEHNAIFQCLAGNDPADVRRITLTASGGPLRCWSPEQLRAATPAQAVAHPNWSMGAKISVDSATMMNKGLELIEAHYLFDMPAAQLDVLIHPQSIVHSLVEYVDGSVLAQLGNPDMRVPIAHALGYPDRIASGASLLDLAAVGRLDFEAPDEARFPCLRIAREALQAGDGAPCVLNAANEVGVAQFLAGRIRFSDIARINQAVLEAMPQHQAPGSLDEAVDLDRRSRRLAMQQLERCHP